MTEFFGIIGDPEHGAEIAQLFDMFRVKNENGYAFNNSENVYTVNKGCIVTTGIENANSDGMQVFTLDSFYKKYPFKVGDEVMYKPMLPILDLYVEAEIINMVWDNEVIYVTSNAHCLLAEQLEKV